MAKKPQVAAVPTVEKMPKEPAEENPFGTWLRSTREKKGWSQVDLAKKANVSQPQISNLESGKSLNPQAETRARLEAALGEKISEGAAEKANAEQKIEGVGTLVDFDPYDELSLPNEYGVYVFYDITDRPVYIGKATKRKISVRIPEHEEKFWFKRPIVDRGAYVKIDDPKLCGQVEEVLIKFLKSNALVNKQFVDRE